MAANTCSQPQEFENGTGAVSNYTLNFPYINREDVLVFVGTEPPYTQYTLGNSGNANEYEWINDSTIRLNAVSGTKNVVFVRVTDRCDPIVEFFAGTSIRAQDLNDNQEQVLFLIQEIIGSLRNAGLDVQLPNDKILLNDLGDVDVDGASNRSYLAFNGTNWEDAAVIRSTDQWVANDSAIATTKAGDERWLNSDGSDVTAGAGLNKDTSTSGVVKLEADLLANGGLTTTPAGDNGELRVVQGTGVTVNASGVNAGVTTIDVVGTSDPDIRLTETLAGTATNTDIGIIGGTNIDVTASGDDITIATSAGLLTDAPNDGNLYGRRNQAWAVVTGGGSSEGVEIVAHTRALNAAAANLDGDDAGTVFLVQDSTNIDGDVQNPGNDNPDPNPAVANLPADPTGGWDSTIQVAVQWTGTAWTFIRYQASTPDLRYVKLNDGNSIQTMQSAGLQMGIGTNDNQIRWQFAFSQGGNRPFSWFRPGDAQTHDVWIGEKPGTAGNHGIYLFPGDETSGNESNSTRLTLQTTKTGAADIVLAINAGERTVNNTQVPNEAVEFYADGRAKFFTGPVEVQRGQGFRIEAAGNGSVTLDVQGASANYKINFPPSGSGGAGRILRTLSSGSGADLEWTTLRDDSANDSRYLRKNNGPGATGQGGGDTMQGLLKLGAADLSTGSSIVATARAVPNNTAWSLGATNVWTIAANNTVLFPLDTNLNIGPPENQCGIFVLLGDGISWTDTDANRGWRFPGGNVIGGTANQRTIVPFIVTAQDGVNNIQINLGNPTVCEAQ